MDIQKLIFQEINLLLCITNFKKHSKELNEVPQSVQKKRKTIKD